MIRSLRLLFPAVILTVLLISCNQDPTSVGSNLLSEKDKFTFHQIDGDSANLYQKTSFFEIVPKLGASQYLLLGKTPYSESSILYRYQVYLPDTTLARISKNEVYVKKAWIEMKPRSVIGDSTSNFDFSVHQMRSNWSALGFDRDSIKSANFHYDQTDVKSGLTVTDTTVRFDLKPEVLKEWFLYAYDSTRAKNNGIILVPGNTSQMRGFVAVQPGATTYENYLFLILERPGYYLDTLAVWPDEDVHVVTRRAGFTPAVNNDFYLEGSYSLRGSIFFDLTSIPKTAIINKATLELTVDHSNELDGSLSSDSLYVQLMGDSTAHKVSSDSLSLSFLSRKANVFSGDISWAIQKWLNGAPNQGLMFTLYDEYSSAARIAFYGSKEPNKALRPKLKITYLQKN